MGKAIRITWGITFLLVAATCAYPPMLIPQTVGIYYFGGDGEREYEVQHTNDGATTYWFPLWRAFEHAQGGGNIHGIKLDVLAIEWAFIFSLAMAATVALCRLPVRVKPKSSALAPDGDARSQS